MGFQPYGPCSSNLRNLWNLWLPGLLCDLRVSVVKTNWIGLWCEKGESCGAAEDPAEWIAWGGGQFFVELLGEA